jgi:hypothetical protein
VVPEVLAALTITGAAFAGVIAGRNAGSTLAGFAVGRITGVVAFAAVSRVGIEIRETDIAAEQGCRTAPVRAGPAARAAPIAAITAGLAAERVLIRIAEAALVATA